MNISDTLSVDPGQKTLAALHPEFATRILRNKTLTRHSIRPHKKTILNLVFASTAPGANRHGGAMLLLRSLLAAILIVAGAFVLGGEIESPFPAHLAQTCAIVEICAGSLLAIGLLTRFAMLTTTAAFATLSTIAIMNGVFDMTSLCCTLLSLGFLILGAGKYSCDFLLRKATIRSASRRRRRIREARLSYKAYRYAALG